MSNGTIPGFTADQTWAMRSIIREAVAEGITAGHSIDCTSKCSRVEDVRATLYGASGLKSRLDRLEEQVATLVWWHRLLVGAVATSWIGILGLVLQLSKG